MKTKPDDFTQNLHLVTKITLILLCAIAVAASWVMLNNYGPHVFSFTFNRVNDEWFNMPTMPKSAGEVASAVINNKMYVAGETNTETMVFDFSTNKWDFVATRIHKGNHHGSAVINGEWYLVGGMGDKSYGTMQIYDPETDTWRTAAGLPWEGGSVCVVALDDVIYACGGIIGFNGGSNPGGTGTTDECAKYDTKSGDDEWVPFKSMPYGRNHAASTTDGEKIWVFGGRIVRNIVANGFDTVQVYDPKTDEWITSEDPGSNLAPIPQRRGGMGSAVYKDKQFYIIGGETRTGANATSENVYNRVDVYNPDTNQWRLGPMRVPRHGSYPILHQGCIHVAGGGTKAGFSHSDVYDKLC